MAVETLEHLLAVHVTSADQQEDAQVQICTMRCSKLPARRSGWRGLIKALLAKTLSGLRRRTALI